VTVVAASGNDNGAVGYPAAYDDYVIAVGATRFDEARAPYSNFGTSLDLVAPGGDTSVDQNGDGYGDGILQQTFNPSTRNVSDFGYYFFQGTSMATPHVAAAVAMVIANGYATTPAEVRMALESTARDLGDSGWDQYFGYGIIDIPAALAWRASPVDAKPAVSITAPLSGAVVSGVVNITANASDDVGVSTVTFAVGGLVVSTDTDGADGWSAAWDTTLISDGGVLVSATALDTIGQETVATVTVTVDNVNDAPVAEAGADQTALVSNTVSFDGSGSHDDRGIVLYEWNFGDGAVATGTAVSHTYSASGTYVVTLAVTDTDGVMDTDTAMVTVFEAALEPFVMGAVGYKVKGIMKADLSWSGATTTNVDVYRNASLVATTVNDGTYTDHINQKGSGTFVYKLCEAGTNTCSNESVVTF
jgi:serine protease